MRLIDADALMDFYLRIPMEEFLCERRFTALNVASKIHGEPTIDPVKHGKWTVLRDCSNSGWYCSNCNKKIYDTEKNIKKRLKNFCPNCGSIMDSEVSG